MKRYRITLENQTFDIQVLDDPRLEQVQVEVDGETFVVGVEAAPLRPRPPRSRKTSEVLEVSEVSAPLPGVIKSIAARAGQKVAPNDELVVIEAMKMDNVIRATRAGTIGAIYVTEGRQVAYGEPLLDLTD
ncbi:MAG: hypothetical protein DRJ03_04290 [Chloroflexi bacterium]|nr:MAG: hypothetical protein DRI81_00045 [Chloroflexota bacterium]RLC87966.1 MAG: hypothetical protein DRJ03_04290 [Chloroflexota bacterium]HEY72353.1 acetyl-CoA carboxylase biotin carboxyl carrier protein subunit [Thermoflexia bacterium]